MSFSFAEVNHFRWTEEYQAMFLQNFDQDPLVEAESFGVEIKLGQKIEIDKKGRMGRVIGSSNSQEPTFKVVNKFGPAKVGVNCRVNGGWKRCYVSPVKSRNGDEVSVAPLPKIMIWFQRDVKTGMKIKDTISNGLEVDFTAGKSSYVARYGATGSTYGEKGVGSEGGSGVWSLVSNMDPDDSQ